MTIFTIGHSNHTEERFYELLRGASITAIADVRSRPKSSYCPHFDQASLEKSLRRAGVAYVFLGRELGARREERECYEGRRASYDLIARTPLFAQGLQRLRSGAERHRIAMLCAEKDPITCHRMVLVGRALLDSGVEVVHVLEDGAQESSASAEARMRHVVGLPDTELFRSPAELTREAYRLQGDRIAWVEPEFGKQAANEIHS